MAPDRGKDEAVNLNQMLLGSGSTRPTKLIVLSDSLTQPATLFFRHLVSLNNSPACFICFENPARLYVDRGRQGETIVLDGRRSDQSEATASDKEMKTIFVNRGDAANLIAQIETVLVGKVCIKLTLRYAPVTELWRRRI